MRRRRKPIIKRTISGTLAGLLAAISVLSTSSAVPVMASESKVKMSYKQEDVEKIGIHVEAENETFSAGESMLLNVYIQNNSGEPLTDGTLKWVDKKETLTQGGFLFESENDTTEAEEATPDSAEEAEAAEETLAPETSAPAATVAAEETPAPEETAAAEETAAPEETAAEEGTAAPEETVPAETEEELAGPSEEVTEASEEAGPAGPSEDVAQTQAAGPASDNEEDYGTAWEEDWFDDDENNDDEEIEGPYMDEEGNICNIDLAPGEIFEVQFAGTIDEDIYGLRTRDIRFTFGARKPNGKRLSNNMKFQFNTGLMTMLPVEFADGNMVECNEENTMVLRLGLDDIEYMFEEIEKDKAEEAATPAEASKATPSEAEEEFTAAEVIRPENEATPSEAAKATPLEAEVTKVVIEAAEEDEATPSETDEEKEEDEDDEYNSDGVFNPEDVKYSIETYGVRLKGVKAKFDEEASGPAESVTEVSYRVASGTEPGLYFGTVTASVRYNGSTYKSVQGFHINVTGEGQMALRGKLGDAEIIVSGDPSSFGAEDSEILSLQVTEVPVEKEGMISEAMEKKAEETGVAVEKMKAMDIKVIADGEVKELEGPVTVTFAGLELEEVKTETATEPEEEKSLVEQAVALLSLDDTTETGTEETTAKNTQVWHLDEDAVELNEMDSDIDEDGNVVMETDHFSIFIVVNVADVATVHVTVKHYAKVKVPETDGDYNLSEPVVANEDGKQIILPGASTETKDYGTYKEEIKEIYSKDELDLPNGAGTGINYSIAAEKLSKVSLSGNYEVKSVTLINADWPDGKTVYETDPEPLELKQPTNTIEIEYVPTTGSSKGYAGFHDYNVTIEGPTAGNDTIHPGLNTQNVGMNNKSLVSSDSRIGIGIRGTGHNNIQYSYDALPRFGRKRNIPKDFLVNGSIQFNYGDPGLFTTKDVTVTETYKDNSTVKYYAKKYLPNYQLEFNREGDTYTLSSVYDSAGAIIASDLETLRYTCDNVDGTGGLYSNLFWPLDSVSYGVEGKTRDHKYGQAENSNTNAGKDDPKTLDDWGFGPNDEGPTAHNWFFGMRYDFEFTLGDYIGPMNYYFRGDDDFWLFIDGEFVSVVDIGGIHSAEGAYVDLRDWMQSQGMLGDTNTPHKMSVFFMERGGFGSCCYMSFTLPNISTIPTPESSTIEKTVTKTWVDGGEDDPFRPSFVYAQLLQDGEKYGSAVKLDSKNSWSYTWKNLPKYSEVNSDEEHEYEVEEVDTPLGYESSVNNETFTITNTLLREVEVEKRWEDTPNSEKVPVNVALFDADGNRVTNDGEELDIKVLDSDNDWEATWEDLPKYNSSGTVIAYYVYEVDAAGTKIESGNTMIGADDHGNDGKFIVSYDSNEPLAVTNTYNYRTVSVEKLWEDPDNKYGVHPETVTVQLYRQVDDDTSSKVKYGDPVVLKANANDSENWKHTWTDLPIKANGTSEKYVYTVQEVGEASGEIVLKAASGDDYSYTVEYSGSDDTGLKIKNTLIPTYLQLEKFVFDTDAGGNELPGEPIVEDYKFLIQLKKLSGESDNTGTLYTSVMLGHEKESGIIKLIVPTNGTWFMVDEIEPMEYRMERIADVTVVNGTGKNDTLPDGKILVLPGKTPEAPYKVKVENRPRHNDYFHHTASVTNRATGGSDGFGDFQQENPFSESDRNVPTSKQLLTALVPEMGEKREEEVFM